MYDIQIRNVVSDGNISVKRVIFIALPPPTLDEKEPLPPATISEESERY
jgi:hypothetical protein